MKTSWDLASTDCDSLAALKNNTGYRWDAALGWTQDS